MNDHSNTKADAAATKAKPADLKNVRVGIIGLGAGTLATYGRPGDRFTFFEIDSAVVKIARDNRLFSFLRDCKGEHEVVMGDGRRSLAKQPNGEFGVLALDADTGEVAWVRVLEDFVYSSAAVAGGPGA